LWLAWAVCFLLLWVSACGLQRQVKIAVIPATEGNLQWDPAHAGANDAAGPAGIFVYWNAPTREDDVEAQIALVERVTDGDYQGLVLAPDQALSLITPVRRVLAHGIPTVIIGSPLPIAAGGNLSYILNDDVEGGHMAAERIAKLLNGHGSVALLGINPDITGIMIRSRAFEELLAQKYPGIQIVEKRVGTFNLAHEEQVAGDTMKAHRDLDAIVALMWPTIDGTLAALDESPASRSIKIVGFDPFGLPMFDQKPNLDCIIREDTRSMGRKAIELIHARLLGQPVPATVTLKPALITRENLGSPDIQQMLAPGQWHWSRTQ
jgi:ribose transport system substrate-binding protein